jgi:hypothetical protein
MNELGQNRKRPHGPWQFLSQLLDALDIPIAEKLGGLRQVGGGCWEGYWWFDSTGPHPLDFSRLETAIRERLSVAHQEDARVQISCSNLNLNSQQVNSGVQKSHAQCQACDWVGKLTARFQLDGALVQPVAVEFYPENPQH